MSSVISVRMTAEQYCECGWQVRAVLLEHVSSYVINLQFDCQSQLAAFVVSMQHIPITTFDVDALINKDQFRTTEFQNGHRTPSVTWRNLTGNATRHGHTLSCWRFL